MKRILYLEDNWIDAADSIPTLEKFGQVQVARTEHQFRQTIDDCASSGNWPDIVVLDQRVRWQDPAKVMVPVPKDVQTGGWEKAGTRSYDYLRERQPPSRVIPVIFYSLVDSENILSIMASKGVKPDPRDYQIIGKTSEFHNLHDAIRKAA